MSRKYPNPRLVKLNRTYTVEEAAAACGKHKNTIRAWIKTGLPICDSRRPTLILGFELRGYLETKRAKRKTKLRAGEIYCVKCRAATHPELGYAVLEAINEKVGSLSGLCSACETVVYRRVSYRRWAATIGNLDVSIPQALEQLVNGNDPSLDCYLN